MVKGWKKTTDQEIVGQDRFIHWQNLNSENDIIIRQEGFLPDSRRTKGFQVHIRLNLKGLGTRKFIGDKKFKTLSKAKAFAMNYMKKHPNG